MRLDEIRARLRQRLADYPFPSEERAFLEDELEVLNILANAERSGKANLSVAFRPRTSTKPKQDDDIWIG